MAADKLNVLQTGGIPPFIEPQFDEYFAMHKLHKAADREAFLTQVAPQIRGIATFGAIPITAEFMQKLPKLEIVANMGVGYDSVDAKWAGEHGIVVTNTPGVLDDEVADTTIALLLNTLRQLPQSERYLRAGKWPEKAFPLTVSTLRNRTIGIIGMGRIGQAIAKRIEAFGRPIVYHSRKPAPGVKYRHYPELLAMARDVDTLIAIVPGGAATKHMINLEVLEALGPDGVLINVARGSVVDEKALIEALRAKKILSAGLDVFEDEPRVPKELIEMDHVVLFPHVASASVETRRAMGQLVVDNLKAWAAGKPPLTPVPETPWPPKSR
jgi:lactate dehydrogenase-like 2-hydroxyacid dehydrogenase